jgi:hypothetical protein
MGDHHQNMASTRPCEACGEKTMAGWRINEAALDGASDARRLVDNLREIRMNQILYSELSEWRKAGMGHRPPSTQKAARQKEATTIAEAQIVADRRQSIEDRDARLAMRKGQAIHAKPKPETVHDARNGPREFTDFVRNAVFGAPDMLVCLNCAGPVILAIKKHREQGERKWSVESALWHELASIAQGQPTTLPRRKVAEGRWFEDRVDLFQRGHCGELKGQTILSEGGQKGKVVLVGQKASGDELPKKAYVYWNSEPPELKLMDIDEVQAACTRAKEEKLRLAEELLEKSMISLQEIQVAHPDEDLVQIENAGAACYTIRRIDLFKDPWAPGNEHREQSKVRMVPLYISEQK